MLDKNRLTRGTCVCVEARATMAKLSLHTQTAAAQLGTPPPRSATFAYKVPLAGGRVDAPRLPASTSRTEAVAPSAQPSAAQPHVSSCGSPSRLTSDPGRLL